MGRFRTVANRLQSFNIVAQIDLILLDLSSTITGMNKEQLSIGQGADGNFLGSYQSTHYGAFKADIMKSKAPLMTADLKLSGDFYDGFIVKLKSTTIEITSTDWKTSQLQRFGDIFGLQPDHLSELAHRYILPKLIIEIRKLFRP